MESDQFKEFVRCHDDFPYFCETYVKLRTPEGIVPFALYEHQKRLVEQLSESRFSIVPQPRRWGLTTSTSVWFLWRCLFRLDQRCMVLTSSDKAAMKACEVVRFALDQLPDWLKPANGKNSHEVSFPDTGGHLSFYTPEPCKGRGLDWLLIDNAAFIPRMESHWKAIFPVLSCGGSCVLQSCHGSDETNWFEKTLKAAEEGESKFRVFRQIGGTTC